MAATAETEMLERPIAVVQAEPSPLAVYQQAVLQGIDPDKIAKLLDLQERVDKARALKAYQASMAACQAEIPAVIKQAENKHTRSRYADLGDIIGTISPVLSDHGFSLSFYEGKAERPDWIRCTVDVMHSEGHRETKWIDLPIDGAGAKGGASSMNAVQAVGSTHSYAQRYLICDLFRIQRAADNDGNTNGALIGEEVADWANKALNDSRRDRGKFFSYCSKVCGREITCLEEISVAKWPTIREMLKRAVAETTGGTA